jgi:hypothetical protein
VPPRGVACEDEAPPGDDRNPEHVRCVVNAAGTPVISVPGEPRIQVGGSAQVVAPFGHDAVAFEIAR